MQLKMVCSDKRDPARRQQQWAIQREPKAGQKVEPEPPHQHPSARPQDAPAQHRGENLAVVDHCVVPRHEQRDGRLVRPDRAVQLVG